MSFPRGLKALVGFGRAAYAVVDVGTNSVKFHLAERAADGSWRQLVDRAEVTRLGEGLGEAGRLQPEPMERTIAAIAAMAVEARRYEAEEIAAVGTAGLRAAANSAELVDAVHARHGVRVEVISGRGGGPALVPRRDVRPRARRRVAGRVRDRRRQHAVHVRARERIEEQFSVPVGAVRFTEQFGLDGVVDETVLAAALDAIAAELASLDGRPAPAALVAMGGAVTNLAAVKHELVDVRPGGRAGQRARRSTTSTG